MHRSRVYAVIIDTPGPDADRSAAFWSAALGARREVVPHEPEFTALHDAIPGLVTAVQSVDDAPRLHLDIETDDVPAEVARLTALGAAPVSRWRDCHVLRAPGGHLLCVLPVESPPDVFGAEANVWR